MADNDNNTEEDYLPQNDSFWEKLLGPGAIAASFVTLLLVVMALIVYYNPRPPTNITYRPF